MSTGMHHHTRPVEAFGAIGETRDADFVAEGFLTLGGYPTAILRHRVAGEHPQTSMVWT